MKQWIYNSLLLLCSCLMLTGCLDDDLVQEGSVGPNVKAVLSWGSAKNNQINIQTRATYEPYYESTVRNLYVFVFANDNKVYGHFFANSNLNEGTAEQFWTAQTVDMGGTIQTNGAIYMNVPSVTSGEIVVIANIDLDFMNISQERLGLVRNKQDLQDLIVTMNQELPMRNAGYFMMTGALADVTIAPDGTISAGGMNPATLMLTRMDAKVEVNVRVNPTEETDGQRVEKFIPESWEVVNLPKSCYLVPNDAGSVPLTADGYFHVAPRKFETNELEKDPSDHATGGVLDGFSFYMLENLQSKNKKQSVAGNYHLRDRRIKNPDGTYNTENGMWEYAPELATYIIIKGELDMEVNTSEGGKQHLLADVVYYVHLGDFARDMDDYDVKRNTNYKYTINVKGVNNISVEVETGEENQSGAMGHLYQAQEDIFTFDAHYGQRVYNFNANEIDLENMTWYVRTPFGRAGIPLKDANGNLVYNDLDYKWVEFYPNEMIDGVYTDRNHHYPGQGAAQLMNVVQFLDKVREEYPKWKAYKEGRTATNESWWDANDDLKVTIYVDEFYYDTNPMNPNDDNKRLWKKFVNQPNRLMHVLCKNNRSADGSSSMTGSILTIRQSSIQTPFNRELSHTSLSEAWGCETVDETGDKNWFYSPYETTANVENYSYKPTGFTPQNTSRQDGLYNTAELLNLVNGNLRWSDYVDYTNRDVVLKDDKSCGLNSILLRNRDLDGDDIVDVEELHWYITSLEQIFALFIGDQGLSVEAQLYPQAVGNLPNALLDVPTGHPLRGVYQWRWHYVTSTANEQTAGNVPVQVWAEEGISTSQYAQNWAKEAVPKVRCARNLGMASPSSQAGDATYIGTAGNNFPKDELVVVTETTGTKNANSIYRFDLRNLNKESRRLAFTSQGLIPGDEYSLQSRVYEGFETGGWYGLTYEANNNGWLQAYPTRIYTPLSANEAPIVDGTFPEGWRIANIRELAIFFQYCNDNNNWWGGANYLPSNFYSFGTYGNSYDGNVNTWFVSQGGITMTMWDGAVLRVRAVRDWVPGT